MRIKLQIAGNIYYTEVERNELDQYLEILDKALVSTSSTSVIKYENEDKDSDIKKLVFKKTVLEAYCLMN